MAIAKWFGQPSSSSGSSAACPPSTDRAKSTAINKAEDKHFGLENFGNTCYVNSVFQALYFCHPFRELIIQAHDKSNPPVTNSNGSAPLTGPPIPIAPPTMFSALRALFVHISSNSLDKGVVAPRAFVEKLKKENELFRSSMHQDAHEFLIYLLNKIAEDLEEEARNVRSGSSSGEDRKTNSSTNSNIVHDLFEGVLTSETRCLTCETVSSRDEAFLDLSIDIEQNSSVTACLRQFSASEMLCQKNKFFCDSCCGLQEAEKRMKIKRLPNVLALHLKRFKYQEDVGKYIKLAYRVAFPLELRLFNTADDAVDPDRLYELFAIVIHIGNGPYHGHYVAIVKSNESWLVFDDDSVEKIKESDISKYYGDSNSGAAYVLFYQALDLDLAALGLKTDEPTATDSAVEASPMQAPLLPPGLTHEGDSDASEFAPATPASPVLQAIPAVASNSSPLPLHVTIPPAETSTSATISIPVPTPTATSPNGKSGGFFSSLRHSPSKPSFGSENRRAAQDVVSPPVPPLPSSIGSPQMSAEPSVASTSTTTPPPTIANGKHKAPKEKTSGWFSRKRSLRPEKEKNPDRLSRPATSHGHGTPDHHDGGSFSSSTNSSRVPLVVMDGADGSSSSRPSVSAMTDSPSLLPSLPVSPKSPQASSSSDTHILRQNGSAVPPLSPSAHTSSHHRDDGMSYQFHLPGHKKSQPSLSGSPTVVESSSRRLPDVRPPKRPSTAGAAESPTHGTFKRLDETAPLPPLPSELRSPLPRPRTAAYDPSIPKEEREQRRFSAAIVPPTTPFKRASRKLSFTGSMLGWGRRDKDKEKEREKEKHNAPSQQQPNSTQSLGASVLQGLSLSGRM
ncbi:cysteine proteinase [Fomitiporia mediterranea MF3/22]|uniref:cysteine proteinase n=1 Tax=Fomitiporia mediterranea (strain MF3/22) TaxID=694068 RepID=UPI0004408406|nr:cysteine proteinase [Fomitiporia mediterranea MF3/22]EJC98825.1 cysteine proteinase [Fomitiporia mediterranea MF3/22]